MPRRDVVVPPGTEDAYAHYHFAAAVRAGGLLLCSGQIGVDDDGTVSDDPDRQFTAAFEALGRVLAAAGYAFDDVVEITTFHVGFPQHLETFMVVKDRYLTEPWPAWTAVGVTALALPNALVEIKATARLRA